MPNPGNYIKQPNLEFALANHLIIQNSFSASPSKTTKILSPLFRPMKAPSEVLLAIFHLQKSHVRDASTNVNGKLQILQQEVHSMKFLVMSRSIL